MSGMMIESVSPASAVDSAITELVTQRCKVTVNETQDEAGEPLKKKDRYPTAWRCKGLGDRFVHVVYSHIRAEIAFGGTGRPRNGYMRHGHPGGWGSSVEWRGQKDKAGRLVPVAAIVAYRWDIPAGEEGGKKDVGADLAVIRLGKSWRDTCVVAWVDSIANPDAIELARRAADDSAPKHVCTSRAEPPYLGKTRERN